MLVYQFARNLAALAMLVLFKKLYYIDSHKLPKKKGATIFAVNHPTAFIDPFIYMVYSRYNCYFLLRGDFFKVSKFVRWFMDQIRLIPIFRQRDGFSALKQNQALFEQFYEIIHQKRDISIMVEGSHDHRKRLRPIQRGAARIVFGTYDKYGDKDITIVPVGVTFSDVTKFRSTAAVKFGDPIYVEDYIELHESNARKAMLGLTKDIGQRIKPLLVHVEREEDDELADHLLDFLRHDTKMLLIPSFSRKSAHLDKEIALVNQLNELEEASKATLRSKVTNYLNLLKSLNVSDLGVSKSKKVGFITTLFILFGSPLFLIGYILGFIPLMIVKKVLSGIKKKEFVTSMMLVAGMFGYFIYFTILLITSLIIGKGWLITGVMIMPLISYFAILYRDIFLEWNAARKFKGLSQNEQSNLKEKRSSILDTFKL